MEKRYIKEQEVSLLGMGCMRFPLIEGTNDIDKELTEKMIDTAIKEGITYFDTAYPYHNGQSELVVGEVLKKYPRDSFTLATKMPSWYLKTEGDAKRIFAEQLVKCQVEYFDFYLCHAMNAEFHELYKRLGVYKDLQELKAEGKIKHLGFSFHDTVKNLIPIADELPWDFAQIQFNYLDYKMQDAKGQYEELTKRGISVVVMEPVRGGLLANICPEAEEIFKAKEPNMSNASWALRFAAKFPNIKVILSGMSNLEHVIDNLNTFNNYKELDEADLEVVENAKNAIFGNNFIPCTGCKYCMPCPMGVNIPKLFMFNNMYGIHKNKDHFKDWLAHMDPKELPDSCIACGKCMRACPQSINIIERLKDIKKTVNE